MLKYTKYNCKVLSGIYKITCLSNNKTYIGSSKNCNVRYNQHTYKLNKGKHKNQHLQNAWNKYGKENFVFEILATCPPEYLIKLEQWFLDSLKPEYNICKIAHSTLGIKLSETVKQNLRNKRLGKKLSEETKAKISFTNTGRKMSVEAVEKTRQANTGSKRTEEQKRNISNSLKGRKASEECKKKISNRFKGGVLTEDHKNKIKNALKNNHENIQRLRHRMQGEGSPNSKLTEEDVKLIRELLFNKSCTARELCKKYGVSENTISNIKHKKCWGHVL